MMIEGLPTRWRDRLIASQLPSYGRN